jgi:hypothetical protein
MAFTALIKEGSIGLEVSEVFIKTLNSNGGLEMVGMPKFAQ